MHAEMTMLDWIVMGAFFAIMVGIGLFSTLLIKNTKDYFTGSGKMPWWLLGVSHHVSGYSAVAFTAYAAIAYNTGFTIYIWWAVPISIACYIGIFFIVSRWARLRTHYNIESPLEYISTRYDVPTQQVLAWWGVLLKILDVGAKWVAVALVITTFAPNIAEPFDRIARMFGYTFVDPVQASFAVAVILSVAVGLCYSTLGGLWAGTITDFAMFLVQFVAGLAMFFIVANKLGGLDSIQTIWERLPEGHSSCFAGEYGTIPCIIGLLIINILGYNGGTWNLAQRYIAAPQGSDAKKAALLSATLYLIWPLVLFFPMWAAPLLIPDLPPDQQAQSFSMMVVRFLPPGLTGLMLAALISHTLTMTTADATAITAVLVRDVVPKVWKRAKHFSTRQQLLTARTITFLFMVMTAVIALYNSYFGGILGLILGWFSALLGPVSIAMILGLLPGFRKCGVWSAQGAILAGILTFIGLKLSPAYAEYMTEMLRLMTAHACAIFGAADPNPAVSTDGTIILAPTLVSFVVYVGIGFLGSAFGFKPKKEAQELLDALSSDIPPHRAFSVGQLHVEVYPNRAGLGIAAGTAAADAIRESIRTNGNARVIFAAAPSQNETLQTLIHAPGIDWTKVTALHMDEYIGLPPRAKERFSHYLKSHLFDHLPFKAVHLLDEPSLQLSTDELLRRYEKLLAEGPIDVVCMGIGENGHIAFNDPPADLSDPAPVKVVDLDDVCRQQQVNDGCFPNIDAVPKQAITLTIPALFAAKRLVCAVPGRTKCAAVRRTLTGEISAECPATVLREHSNATLYVDTDSCDLETDKF